MRDQRTGGESEGGQQMRGDLIQDFLVSGIPLLALLPIPLLAVACAVALGIGLIRRNLPLTVGSIVLAVAVGGVAEALRSFSADPSAVDALVMQLPFALAVGALASIVRLTPATVRVIRRRVRAVKVDTGLAAPATVGVATIVE